MDAKENWAIITAAIIIVAGMYLVLQFNKSAVVESYVCYYGAPDPWLSDNTVYGSIRRLYTSYDKLMYFNVTCVNKTAWSGCGDLYTTVYEKKVIVPENAVLRLMD